MTVTTRSENRIGDDTRAAAKAPLVPRLPIRSRAAKSDVAIFILLTSFLSDLYEHMIQGLCQPNRHKKSTDNRGRCRLRRFQIGDVTIEL